MPPEKKNAGFVSTAVVAAMLGVTSSQVARLVRDHGLPVAEQARGRRGSLYDIKSVHEWDMARKHVALEDEEPTTLQHERLRLTKEQADEKAIKNELDRGNLMWADHVREASMEMIAGFRSELRGVAGRLASSITGEPDEAVVHSMIGKEIDRSLNGCARSIDKLAKRLDSLANAGANS